MLTLDRSAPWLVLSLALLHGCGGTETPTTSAQPGTSEPLSQSDTPPSTDEIGLPAEGRIDERIIAGGQPDPAALARAQQQGVSTVISLRAPSEPGFEDERQEVERLGMRFVSIPVEGADGLTEANATAVDQAIAESAPAPVVLHCGTGNRAGAIVALRAFHVQGATPEQALELGRQAGLTGLEAAVVEHFEEACRGAAPPAGCP